LKLPPCRNRHCPVAWPSDRLIAAVPEHTLGAGSDLARGYRTDYSATGFPPPGAGRPGRFSPLEGVSHAYAARFASAAVLETALRDVDSRDRLVVAPQLAGWAVSQVVATRSLVLADLRGPSLAALELSPEQLTTAGPAHYRCTGQWAAALHRRGFDGIVWHSRQAALYRDRARQLGGLAQAILAHAAIEAFAYWGSPNDGLFAPAGNPPTVLRNPDGSPGPLVVDLAALLGLQLETDRPSA
jgi:hypothetical protein